MMNNLLQNQVTMYLFDNLPFDIIRYEIIPHLNYYERMAVNISLPPQDRIRSPLKKIPEFIFIPFPVHIPPVGKHFSVMSPPFTQIEVSVFGTIIGNDFTLIIVESFRAQVPVP